MRATQPVTTHRHREDPAMTLTQAATLASIAAFFVAAGTGCADRSATVPSSEARAETPPERAERATAGDEYMPAQFFEQERAARIEPLPPQF
jgi:hypothetical protein